MEKRGRNRHARPDQCLFGRAGRALYSAQIVSGPENTHLKHSMLIHPGADEGPTHGRPAANDSRKHSPQRKNAAQQRVRKWLPKNLTVTGRGIKNPNLFRYLCTKGIWLCIARSPRKASPFDGYPSYDNRMSPPPKTLTCAKKWHSKNEISSSPGGLFDEFRPSQVPKNLTFDHFFSKYVSRKTSPVSQVGACDPCPEKAHLKANGAGKPGFPSRKVSPLGHHRPRRALLLCKMASTSRKSSRQISVESRGTSPFAKFAQKMGRIGARSRSCKFSPMSAQAENCEVRHSAASTAVWPPKTLTFRKTCVLL